jgi:large conductance mechanosensitive channel
VLKGFRDFILGGNVVELAVAVVIGVAFGTVVNSVVTNLITPLIALVGGTPDFSQIRTGPILWGNLINDVLAFLITAAVVYFVVVLPMSRAGEDEALRAAAAAHAGVPGVPERHPPGGATVRLLHGRGPTGGHGAAADGVVAHGR